jgi:hypothetical protein
MTQFTEGEEVEVSRVKRDENGLRCGLEWRKAKIMHEAKSEPGKWKVIFPGGDGAVFNAEHIRATKPYEQMGLCPKASFD